MSDLDDLIAAGAARDAEYLALPDFTGGGGGNVFMDLFSGGGSSPGMWADTFDFGDIGGLMPVENLPSGGGLTDLFRNVAQLVQIGYQGEAQVQQQKLYNRIAAAKLANQLDTVRTTPNVWLVLGAAGVAAFLIFDRRDSRRYK